MVSVVRAPLTKLLELVRRELGAVDARFELGGNPPSEPTVLWRELDQEWRVVVIYDRVPNDRAALLARLETLVDSFAVVSEPVRPPFASVPPGDLVERRLDETVAALADLALASSAIVIDRKSPVIWASSRRRAGEEVEDLLELARFHGLADTAGIVLEPSSADDEAAIAHSLQERGLGPVVARRLAGELSGSTSEEWFARVLLAHAVAGVRSDQSLEPRSRREVEEGAWVSRAFAGSYLLVVTFAGPVAELALERATHRAMAYVEALLLRLPPHDPGPMGSSRALRLVRKT